MKAKKTRFRKKASSCGVVEHGYHRTDMPLHDHENEMDHTFLLYKGYRSAKYQQSRNHIKFIYYACIFSTRNKQTMKKTQRFIMQS